MPDGDRSFPSRAIPWPVWALLVGAIVQLGVQIAPDSYRVFGPYFLVDGGMVLSWLQSITPFLLAAAVILAAERWPSGHRTLLVGASVLVVVALLRMGSDVWWALWEASGHTWDPSPPWLLAGLVATGLLFVIGHVLLAAGLWANRSTRPTDRARIAVMATIGFVGIVAVGVALWVVAQTLALVPADHRVYSTTISMLTAAGLAALTLVAVAAVLVAPRTGGMPEILIAAGAVIAMAASAWAWSFPNLVPLQEVPEQSFIWVFTLPRAAEVAGWLTMIAGFGLAALAARRAGAADDADA
jgi:hypothetical protein